MMSRIAFVGGRYLPITVPAVRIEDRGYQFADGVYEVIKAIGGSLLDLERHLDRLDRSLMALAIPMPMGRRALVLVLKEVLRRNKLSNAAVYLQVNRGVAPRSHVHGNLLRPSLVITARAAKFPSLREMEEGVRVITLRDERWAKCDIKSISLLPNVLAKQQAALAGCREAWLLDRDGFITEGSSSNAYLVDAQGRIITRPLGPEILGGVTRSVVLELARAAGIEVIERPFSVQEALEAREAFLTSTTSLVLPVTEIDGRAIGNGRPGSISMRLATDYAAANRLEWLAPQLQVAA
jgi:D-alanine transaminase